MSRRDQRHCLIFAKRVRNWPRQLSADFPFTPPTKLSSEIARGILPIRCKELLE